MNKAVITLMAVFAAGCIVAGQAVAEEAEVELKGMVLDGLDFKKEGERIIKSAPEEVLKHATNQANGNIKLVSLSGIV